MPILDFDKDNFACRNLTERAKPARGEILWQVFPQGVIVKLDMKLLKPALLDFLFPPICHTCRTFIPDAGEIHICGNCREQLPLVKSPLCPVCGIPYPGVGDDHVCGQCLTHPPHFDFARASLLYDGAVSKMIHSFKYLYKTHLRRPLALLALEGLGEFITSVKPEVIIPVPLHISRLRKRGFNQAVLLGEIFSDRLSIPMRVKAVARIRRTEPQIDLSGEARRTNVKGAFAVQDHTCIHGRRVLLLDDVMTTGSTADECAKELKKAGALSVIVITIARTGH